MKTITSTSNPTIKFIRGLKSRKIRKQSNQFFIEGIRQVGEAFENAFPLEYVIYCPELLISEYGLNLVEKISASNIDLIEVPAEIFQLIAAKEGPQGLAAVGMQRLHTFEDSKINGLWILLEDIQDPGNLGTILRSLDGAGGKGVIMIGDTTDPYHPTAVRSSTGSLFYTPIIKASIEQFSAWKQDSNYFCAGTICSDGENYRSLTYPEDMVLAMGSEQKGLTYALKKSCDTFITIPMTGKVDSLNLAIAASIVLFEIYARKSE